MLFLSCKYLGRIKPGCHKDTSGKVLVEVRVKDCFHDTHFKFMVVAPSLYGDFRRFLSLDEPLNNTCFILDVDSRLRSRHCLCLGCGTKVYERLTDLSRILPLQF